MVGSVAGAVEGTQGCSVRSEDLKVGDGVLIASRIVFVDFGVGTVREKVFDAANVIGVPVR